MGRIRPLVGVLAPDPSRLDRDRTPSTMDTMNSLDAASPFVLDTKPLGRRAGAMTTVRRTEAAPADWAVSSCGVAPGSPVELDLRLESVVEGVLVSGTAGVQIVGECSRCLEPVRAPLRVAVQQLFEYPNAEPTPEADEDPLPRLVGELLDLEPTLRDAVVLDLPLVPLCTAECPGLCEVCGARLADDPGHGHDTTDDRWAALQEWLTAAEDLPAPTAGGPETSEKGN